MRHGEVWLVRSDKVRPAVVLTRDPVANQLNAVVVVAVTSRVRGLRSEVPLDKADGVLRPSVANLDMTQRVDRSAFVKRIGRVRESTMDAICAAMHYSIGC